MRLLEKARVPPLLVETGELERTFPRWLATFRPDVVVSTGPLVHHLLERAGVKVPNDVGFACLNLTEPMERPLAGMMTDFAGIGRAAVDLLHAQILRGEGGIPPAQRGVVVNARWHAGDTVRRVTR